MFIWLSALRCVRKGESQSGQPVSDRSRFQALSGWLAETPHQCKRFITHV